MPVPVGSPPCAMKPSSTRWKVTPSKKPLHARKTKLFTVIGALAGNNSAENSPPFAIKNVAKYCFASNVHTSLRFRNIRPGENCSHEQDQANRNILDHLL